MIIDLKNVSWKRDGKWVLENISWQVKEKEHWCILGLNGSGKTTLLNLINGYIWPTKGEIEILGNKFGKTDLRKLRQSIGWVSSSLQQQLPNDEIAENIVLSGKYASIGLYDQTDEMDKEKADRILSELKCEHLKKRQYQTLSQGERQRILIARALMALPKLLILDEPCTGLDIISREHLLKMIEALTKQSEGPTLIYVTHHVEEVLPCFKKVLLLKNGVVFDSGSTTNLLNAERLSNFYQVPVSINRNNGRTWIALKEKDTLTTHVLQ
ncbi:ABC transporter ATP-binding protein [Heyndrickxia sporothermodurans]